MVGLKVMSEIIKYTKEEILAIMPQQPPFLFVDTAEVEDNVIRGSYYITGDEPFLKGHFPNNPVFPASLMLEAFGQAAIVRLMNGNFDASGKKADKTKVFFTSADGVKCARICKPGDTLNFEIKLKLARHPMAIFEGKLTVDGKMAAFAEKITLIFDYLKDE